MALPKLASLIIHLDDNAVKLHQTNPAYVQAYAERHIAKHGHANKERIAFLVNRRNEPVGLMLKCRYGNVEVCLDRMDIKKEKLHRGAPGRMANILMEMLKQEAARR